MEYIRLNKDHMEALQALHLNYKREIGEDMPTAENLKSLLEAIVSGQILFYGCLDEKGALIACCSVTPAYSTFNYQQGGILEDFYILPAYRHQGIARRLVRFAYQESGIGSLTVGCADCDADMYRALGFTLRLGNLLAYEA